MSDAGELATDSRDGGSERSVQADIQSKGETSSKAEISSRHIPSIVTQDDTSDLERPPPLPPRPARSESQRRVSNAILAGFPTTQSSTRPQLQATATTAVSRTDIHTQPAQSGSREARAIPKQLSPPAKSWSGWGSIRRLKIQDGDDSTSIRSYAPTLGTGGDAESLLGDVLGSEYTSGWNIFSGQLEETGLEQPDASIGEEVLHDFDQEFEEIDMLASGADDEGRSDTASTRQAGCPN